MSVYRRRMGAYFSLLHLSPWQGQGDDVYLRPIDDAFGIDGCFDLILDQSFSLYKAVGVAQGPRQLKVSQFDGALTVSGRDMATLATFTLSVGTDTIEQTRKRFAPLHDRIERLVLRMPSKEFRTFVFMDWRLLAAEPSRLDLAVQAESCIFVPHLASETAAHDLTEPVLVQMAAAPQPVTVIVPPVAALAEPVDAVPVLPSVAALAEPVDPAPVMPPAVAVPSPQVPPADVAKSGSERRTLTLILPLTDDLRTSFLGFGYSVGAASHAVRPLEIGAFRRNLRSSYSRLMGGTDVVDLKAQAPSPQVASELQATLHTFLTEHPAAPCFIGSEVLLPEVLEILRSFAVDSDLSIQAIVCSATVPAPDVLAMITDGLAMPDLRVQLICFVAPGEPSGQFDATGRPRAYFGLPPVEGQSMARCMEFRSNVEDPAFIIPALIPSREAHALERFVNAFRPLQEGFQEKPAA